MRPRTAIILTAFLLAFLETFVVASEPFWIIEYFRPSTSSEITSIVSWFRIASLLIDPAVVFLVMFSIGRKFAALVEFPSVLFWALLGSLVGTYACLGALTAHAYIAGLFQASESQLLQDLIYDAFGAFRLALVVFASLAFAYFTSRGSSAGNEIAP